MPFDGSLKNKIALCPNISGTIWSWISLLETSGILFLLPSYYRNMGKRLIKSPKLYFIDTGILCRLLSIRTTEQLRAHPMYGAVFETFVIGELYKRYRHAGETPPLFYFRDKTGNEIDLLIEDGQNLIPIEVKSAMTFDPSFKDSIVKWRRLSSNATASKGFVIYNGGAVVGQDTDIAAVPWNQFI